MAEARQAVAFQFQVTDEGSLRVNLDRKLLYSIGLSVFRASVLRYQRARNAVQRTIFPASPYTLVALLGILMSVDYLLPDNSALAFKAYVPGIGLLPSAAQGPLAALLVSITVWTVGLYIQRYLLMFALSYKGFMFVPHGKTPLTVKIWFVLVKILRGPWSPSTLYAYQSALPRLPVPSVSATIRRYLETARPLNDEENFARLSKLAKEFENGLGRRLQRYVWLKWLWSNNYVSDWWERYVYLRGRSPLMINSNYYVLDSFDSLTSIQAARCGVVINLFAKCKMEIETETLSPLVIQAAVPVCMDQYKRTFGSARIPGQEQDTIEHVFGSKSSYVAVMRRGRYYRVPMTWNGRLLNPAELEKFLQCILDDDETATPATKGELDLPAFTAEDRTKWATFREKYLLSNANNRRTLRMIEDAAFFLVLEDERVDLENDNEEKLSEFGRKGLHGNGTNRWFDKSMSLCVYSNGLTTCTAEHSWADAPVVAHVLEYAFYHEQKQDFYAPSGHCYGEVNCVVGAPTRFTWQLPKETDTLVAEARVNALARIADLDLHILAHTQFGKGAIKKCRTSPDAFIQMALQLAYYRDVGKFSLTYEASMTRLYREGRTETVRPVSVESCAFVRAMDDPMVPVEQKKALLKAAAEKHQDSYRHAMAGNGVDRHLFTLYVVSKYLNVDSPFLKEVLSEPWRLSTSQTPHSQMIGVTRNKERFSAGGGFGPVADDGYGVSYIIIDDHRIYFHISSKHSCPATSSRRFAKELTRASREIFELFHPKK